MARPTRGRKAWAIDERRAPSASPYIRTARAWWRSVRARLPAAPDVDPTPAAVEWYLAQARGVLLTAQPPGHREIRSVAVTAGMASVRAELRQLVRIGMPPQVLRRLTGEPEPVRVDARTTTRGRSPRARISVAEIDRATGALLVPSVDIRRGGVLQADLDAWALDGARYIQRIPAATAAALSERIAPLAAEGARWETIVQAVAAEMEASAARLELIARDQTAKLNSHITETLQSRAGVTSYRWRSTNDSRTRKVHREANGAVVEWASAGYPGAGFYGQPAHAGRGGQCRCTAEPIPPDGWLDL